jgi:hypothetical protein
MRRAVYPGHMWHRLPIRAACCFSTSMISVPIAADRAYVHTKSSVFVFRYAVPDPESSTSCPPNSFFLSSCVDWLERIDSRRRETKGKESIQQWEKDNKTNTYHHTIDLFRPVSDHVPQSAFFIGILVQTCPGLAIPGWHCRVIWYNFSMTMAFSQSLWLTSKVARIIRG